MKIAAQFVRARGLSSSAICYFGGGQYSHVDIVFDKDNPFGYPPGLLGARSDDPAGNGRGVQLRPFDYTDWIKRDILQLDVSYDVGERFYNTAWSQRGKGYDKTAIWGFATGRDWRDPHDWFCSEFLIWVSEQSDAIHRLACEPWKIFPGEAAVAWSAAGARLVR